MRKKLLYLIILILISTIFSYIIFSLIDNRKKEDLESEKELIKITYKTVIKAFKIHSNLIYFNRINTPQIKKLLLNINEASKEEKNIIKVQLYNELIDMYKNMSDFKLRQLHFHLKNNESFLRFHKPEKFGDSLKGVRSTVEYVNRYKKAIYGFEEGKIFNGYRFVYPLEYKNKYLGSVETSVSMDSIIKEMKEELNSNTDFIIKKEIVEKKVLKEEKAKYIQSAVLTDFYHEKTVSNGGNPLIKELLKKYLTSNTIEKKLQKGEIFNFFCSNKEQTYILTFFPVKNAISKQSVAYIIFANKNHDFKEYENQYILFLSILILLIITLMYFIYKIDEKKNKLINKDKILKKVQEIGKLGYWKFDLVKNQLIWSDEVYNIFELRKHEFEKTYENFLKYVHPHDLEKVTKVYEESLKNRTNYQVEHRIITQTGKIKYVEEECHHTFDEKGNIVQSLGTVHDITNIKIYQAQIEKAKKQFESLVSHIPDIVYRCEIDKNLTVLFINNAIETITGYKKEEIQQNKGISFSSIIHPEDIKKLDKAITSLIKKDKESIEIEHRIITKNRKIIWVDNFLKMLEENKHQFIEGIINDITIQKENYIKLQKFIDTQDNIVILTDSEKLNFANKKFFSFLGYENLENFKKFYSCICELFIENDRFFHLGKIKKDENWIEEIQKIPSSQRVVALLGQDFSIHTFSVTVNKFENNLFIVSFTDISETMTEQIELEEKTVHDKLTSAFNREYFDLNYKKFIKEYTKEKTHLAISILDIDFFKKVNDNFGHDIGDYVLKELVSEINRFSRKDDILIRWGGEEFILILKVESEKGLYKALEHIRKIIELHYFEKVEKITCSFGASIYKNNESIETTIKRADNALYKAKETGRNRVIIE
ncbi:sensor domain-containing diguanylate cyclase [Halarcobacter anaerophilus]|uniref:diguanylate cyclase n=1 Tax=Halarcobacter anaerophilus TaxID=877500 RepID=A0A4Q0XXD7_9BACT|nr:diguanylate cyclase [Halarcobacter anaerophilus]QDF30178.1 multi-sensor domain-containing diguanylate cyclase [Halarcobacter anaerophilus]RXJ62257.1 hypothetical protein CRV06_10900 [Halarcobacter anaerophilus]